MANMSCRSPSIFTIFDLCRFTIVDPHLSFKIIVGIILLTYNSARNLDIVSFSIGWEKMKILI